MKGKWGELLLWIFEVVDAGKSGLSARFLRVTRKHPKQCDHEEGKTYRETARQGRERATERKRKKEEKEQRAIEGRVSVNPAHALPRDFRLE